MTESLFERLGGEPVITALAEVLYDRIYNDQRLNSFFTDVDRAKMERKQVRFLSDIFGGPKLEQGLDLRKIHKPLVEKGLNEEMFNAVAVHVQEIMQQMKVPQADIEEALGAVAAFKPDILNQ